MKIEEKIKESFDAIERRLAKPVYDPDTNTFFNTAGKTGFTALEKASQFIQYELDFDHENHHTLAEEIETAKNERLILKGLMEDLKTDIDILIDSNKPGLPDENNGRKG